MLKCIVRSPSILSASNTCRGLPWSIVIKFVISAKALIGLSPILISFFTSHSGLLRLETLRKYLPKTYSQLLPSSLTSQLIGLLKLEDSIFSIFNSFNVPQPLAAKSRAIPLTLKQSPLFGVIAISNTGSFKPSAVTASVPSAIF